MKTPSREFELVNDWPRSWTRLIGSAIQERRKQLGMSAEDLSAACRKRGLEIQRPVLSNLENGRRQGVTVHQLVVIAAALRTSPLALLFPQQPEPIEYQPGQLMSWEQCMISFTGDEQIIREPTPEEFETLGGALAAALEKELARQRRKAREAEDVPAPWDAVSQAISAMWFKGAGKDER